MAKKTTAIATWDEELAKQAEEYANQEANTGGGQFFSIRGGTLTLNGAPVPNNEMAVIVMDSVLENVYYEGDFNPDSPSAPTCYAFGRDEKTMAPHEEVEQKQAVSCADCPMNAWGSSNKGRGKACRNRRRLALIPAGGLDDGNFQAFEDPDEFARAAVVYLPIPPTSINGFGAYTKQVFGALKRPPFAVFTKVSVVPDAKTQVKVLFELLGPVPDELVKVLMEKNREVKATIEFPYAKPEEAPAPPPRRAPVRQQRQAAPAKVPAKAQVRQAAAPTGRTVRSSSKF